MIAQIQVGRTQAVNGIRPNWPLKICVFLRQKTSHILD